MEIYYRKGGWVLAIIFGFSALMVLMAQLGVITLNNPPSPAIAYSIIAVLSFLALLVIFASTRMYFNNDIRACIQERKHFGNTKQLVFPYSDILSITVRQYRKQNNDPGGYEVAFTHKTTVFGQQATKYMQLRHFGTTIQDYSNAIEFAQEICQYSGINYTDDTLIHKA